MSFRPIQAGEDLWHVFNLVRTGDKVAATTYRKVQRDTGMGTDSERIKLRLMIQVEDIDYDAAGVCGVWGVGWGSGG